MVGGHVLHGGPGDGDVALPRLSPVTGRRANAARVAKAGLGVACVLAALVLALVGGSAFLVGVLLAVLVGAYLLHSSWLSRRTEALERLAGVDDLTGLGNQRVLWEAMSNHIEGSRPGPLSLVMVDVDGFKEINDHYGHQVGDAVLRATAISVKEQVPGAGLCFRYGGDELLVIAPGTIEEAACELAEDIRRAVAGQQLGLPAVTVSCGVAQAESSWGPWELMDSADRALHAAKRSGRNRVVRARKIPVDAAFYEPEHEVDVVRRTALEVAAATLLARDSGTAHHADDVVKLAGSIASRLGIKGAQHDELLAAAKLHDIGKVAIGPEVLNKPGPLNAEEWAIMREHTPIGERILRAVPHMAEVATIVRHSHEHYDGGGYPDALRGERIPLASRVILCADAFHAIRSDRPYRRGRSAPEAMQEIRANSGTQFDPRVVDALEKEARELRSGFRGKTVDPRRVASPRLLALLLTLAIGSSAMASSRPLRHWASSVLNGGGSHRHHGRSDVIARRGCLEPAAPLCAEEIINESGAGTTGAGLPVSERGRSRPGASRATPGGGRHQNRSRPAAATAAQAPRGSGSGGGEAPHEVTEPALADAGTTAAQQSLFVDASSSTKADPVPSQERPHGSPRRTRGHGPHKQPQKMPPPARGRVPSKGPATKPDHKGKHPEHTKGAPDKSHKGRTPNPGDGKPGKSPGGDARPGHGNDGHGNSPAANKASARASQSGAAARPASTNPSALSANPGTADGSSAVPVGEDARVGPDPGIASSTDILDGASSVLSNVLDSSSPSDGGAVESSVADIASGAEAVGTAENSDTLSTDVPEESGQDFIDPQAGADGVPDPAEEPSDATTAEPAPPSVDQPTDQFPAGPSAPDSEPSP